MGWLDTPEQRRRQHLQMFATGNIKDIDKIQERNRRRNITSIFWILFLISGLLGFFYVKTFKSGYWLMGVSLLFLIILIFRYGLYKKLKKTQKSRKRTQKGKRKKGNWKRIEKLPSWAYKKMKKKKTNKVNGEHYVYKREGRRFYRKKKN